MKLYSLRRENKNQTNKQTNRQTNERTNKRIKTKYYYVNKFIKINFLKFQIEFSQTTNLRKNNVPPCLFHLIVKSFGKREKSFFQTSILHPNERAQRIIIIIINLLRLN